MFFKQIQTPGLGCYSYFIGCPAAGTMMIVDPKRDIKDYLDIARQEKMKITHIFDTHVHADHMSGARELQKACGADIYIHESAPVGYKAKKVKHGDKFTFGSVEMEVLHTPGHTPNSVSFLITDTKVTNDPTMILTGDLLFVGDIGRPDLPGDEILAEQVENLYNSLHKTLAPYPDDMEVYPGHGQGSLCGKSMSSKPHSTLGQERKYNWAFQKPDFKDFKKKILGDLPLRPQSFSYIIETNVEGVPYLDLNPYREYEIDLEKVEELISKGAVVVDTRDPYAFAGGHIPGSINIEGNVKALANWLGTVIAPKTPIILLLSHKDQYRDLQVQLDRIGYDTLGCIKGGMTDWIGAGKKFVSLPIISASELSEKMKSATPPMLINVSTSEEAMHDCFDNSINLPIYDLVSTDTCPPLSNDVVVLCPSGLRAIIAASLIQKQCKTVSVLGGGLIAWEAFKESN